MAGADPPGHVSWTGAQIIYSLIHKLGTPDSKVDTPYIPGQIEGNESLLASVPANLVQSIRAFRVGELQEEAARLEQHFLYAHCIAGATKQQVLGIISESFQFPKGVGKNFDGLRETLTETMFQAGAQTGFLVVLEQLPNTQKFDKEARETLLDVFRDAADYWADKKVPFRVFYSFE